MRAALAWPGPSKHTAPFLRGTGAVILFGYPSGPLIVPWN